MKTQDKKEIREIFNEGITQLVLPLLDKIIEKQEDHSERFDDVDYRLNRMELKLDSNVKRFDNHDVRISRLEKICK